MQYRAFNLLISLVIVGCLSNYNFAIAQQPTRIDSMSSKAATLFDQGDEDKALQTYLKILDRDPEYFEALWHTSLLYARIGFRTNSQSKRKSYYNQSLKYAEKTLELYPNKGYSHFVYALAQGRMSDISDMSTRIEKSHIIKKHTDSATTLLPDYAPAWHLLGTWHSEVANVSSVQNLAAGVFSEGLPEGATNKEAVQYIQKAIDLDPTETIRFKLDLARHYNRSGDHQKAVSVLKEVVKMKPKNHIDEWNIERAQKLLNELP